MNRLLFVLIFSSFLLLIINTTDAQQNKSFVKAINGHFYISDKQYHFIGTNFWYGAMLGSRGVGGDRKRLIKELDLMKANGINNLRVLVGADGEDNLASKVQPALQTKPGVYNDTIFDGLDYLLTEMGKRNMVAVLYVNDTWEWSGGYIQYVEWTGDYGKKVLPSDGWELFCKYAGHFLQSDKAKKMFSNHLTHVIQRTNRYTGKKYTDDPAIMAWQIGNEPRALTNENKPLLSAWLKTEAAHIKSLDKNHLVCTGSEGSMGCEGDMELWKDIHASKDIDYATIHIWPYNWDWIDKKNLSGSIVGATGKMMAYLNDHLTIAQQQNKPLVIEEFGIPREGFSCSTDSTTINRDYAYKNLLDAFIFSIKQNSVLAGCNFWAWGGTGRATKGHPYWLKGDQYLGDPAHEEQGYNSVFDTDNTLKLIKEYNLKIGGK